MVLVMFQGMIRVADGAIVFQGMIRVADGAVLDRETTSVIKITVRVQDSPNHPDVAKYSSVLVSVTAVFHDLHLLGLILVINMFCIICLLFAFLKTFSVTFIFDRVVLCAMVNNKVRLRGNFSFG